MRILQSFFNGIAASGYLVTVRDGSLLAYPFDERSARITGDPIQVADHLGGSSAQRAAFSLSSNGILVHGGDTNEISRLTWFDRSGRETDPQVPPGNIATFRLSPDGGQVATTRVNTSLNTTDIWVTDLERSSSTRFTLDPANDLSPVWSRDGKHIVFRSDRNGTNVLFRKPSSGAAEDEQIGTFSASNPTDWTTDGRHILFHQTVVKTSSDLGLAALDGTPPTYLVNTRVRRVRRPILARWTMVDVRLQRIGPGRGLCATVPDHRQQMDCVVERRQRAAMAGRRPRVVLPGGRRHADGCLC